MISIITPMFNAEKYIAYAIQSVLSQTYQDWEMIIVNDCSSDHSLEIAEQYAKTDLRIKILNLTRNTGIASARNVGIANATGSYIAFLDSDDIWAKDKLSLQLKYMYDNGYSFTYTSCKLIDESGAPMHKILKVRSSVCYSELLKSNHIACSSVMIDVNEINVSMPDLHHEDYATWLGILKKGYIAYGIDPALTIYRVRKSSLSANKLKSLSWVYNIYRNYLKIAPLQSLYHIFVYFFHSAIKYAGALKVVFRN